MSNPESRLAFRVLELLLKPIARSCIRHALSIQDFCNLSKVVFVRTAEEEILKTTSKVNVSRLSVMTGLYRKDVTKIYKENEEPAQQAPSILGRILTQWEQDQRFCTRNGLPRALTADGEDSEFRKLVYTVSSHVNAGTIMFELERLGAIKRHGSHVRLVRVYQRTAKDKIEAYAILARSIETIVAGVEENIEEERALKNLHLRTDYDNIYQSDLPVIREWLVSEGKLFHKRVRDFLSQFDKDINPRTGDAVAGGKVCVEAFSLTTKFPDSGSSDDPEVITEPPSQ